MTKTLQICGPRYEINELPETRTSSVSGGTIGPLYSSKPSALLVMNSRLR